MNTEKDKFAVVDSVVAEYGRATMSDLVDAHERSVIMLKTFEALIHERVNMPYRERLNLDYPHGDDLPPPLQKPQEPEVHPSVIEVIAPKPIQFDLETEIEKLADTLSPASTPKTPTLEEAKEFIRRDMDRARAVLKDMATRKPPTTAEVKEAAKEIEEIVVKSKKAPSAAVISNTTLHTDPEAEPEVISATDKKRIVVPKGLETE